jgi:Mg2+ and Co2+ transporter CorA
MRDKQSLTSKTFYSIYRLKHDLLHLRILFNPLIDIIHRLQRTTQDERFLLYPHTESSLRLDMKHHIIRRQITTLYPSPLATDSLTNTTMNLMNQPRRTSKFFNQPIYIYLSDLNDHINQLIDSLELQRESVSILISFWLNLSNNETQETLKFLMLISALFMPCMTLVGIYSTNFQNHPDYAYQNGRYILFSVLATIIIGMITWYKFKGWI